MDKTKTNRRTRILIATIAILCFQILFFQLTIVMLQKSAKIIPGLSNDCYLMIHHIYMFLPVFLLTILIGKFAKTDFGYHLKDWKKGLGWCGIAVAIIIAIRIILKIVYVSWGVHFRLDTFIFQLVFSGLGEEILYRSIPLSILPLVWGDEMSIKIGKKYKVYIDVLISALFFALGHIFFQFGVSGINFSWVQLVSAFLIGICIGMIYKKTNSVWTCMIIHGIVNIIAVTI